MKTTTIETTTIRPVHTVLADFRIQNGIPTLIKGRELPSADECVSVVTTLANDSRSVLETGANFIAISEGAPALYLPEFTEDGQPVMNGDAQKLTCITAKERVMARLGEVAKSDDQVKRMIAILPAVKTKARVMALYPNSNAAKVSVFAFVELESMLKTALTVEGEGSKARTVLALPECAPVIDAIKSGNAPVNAVRKLRDECQHAANLSACVVAGKALPFKIKGPDEALAIAKARKEAKVSLTDGETALLVADAAKTAADAAKASAPAAAAAPAPGTGASEVATVGATQGATPASAPASAPADAAKAPDSVSGYDHDVQQGALRANSLVTLYGPLKLSSEAKLALVAQLTLAFPGVELRIERASGTGKNAKWLPLVTRTKDGFELTK